MRTQALAAGSRRGTVLLWSSLVLIGLTFAIPCLRFPPVLGFVPLPGTLVATIAAITVMYVVAAELTKHWFYRTVSDRDDWRPAVAV